MSVTFPNVPIAPGVPAVARGILNAIAATSAPQIPLLPNNVAVQAALSAKWGLYTQAGNLAADWDNVISIEGQIESRISDYPVEKGGFATYNKVRVPNEVRLILSRGGTVGERIRFLGAIQSAATGIELFNVLMPEGIFINVNVISYRVVRQSDHGMGLLVLELSLRSVRETAKLAFTNTKDVASAGKANSGPVQTSAPTAAETSNAGTPR